MIPYKFWTNEHLDGNFALDTETTVVDYPREIPTLVLITVSNGKDNYIIHPKNLKEFLFKHTNQHIFFFNISFDWWVIYYNIPELQNWLFNLVDNNYAHDTMIMDGLYRLACDDEFPRMYNLGVVAKRYANLEVNKDDPYRMRYEEILDKDWSEVDKGFFEYAINDAYSTFLASQKLYKRAKEKITEIPNNVIRQFGILSEYIQIKGALALTKITHTGLHLDVGYSNSVYREFKTIVDDITEELNNRYPKTEDQLGLFKKKKNGEFEYTKTGNISRSNKRLHAILEDVAKELGIKEIPRSEKGKVSAALDVWDDWIEHSEFLTLFARLTEYTKLTQFFKKLQVDRIHPPYKNFVRTGRTSQNNPNCFDGETELLTNKGWIKLKDINKEDTDLLIAQWDEGEIVFVKPLAWIENEFKGAFLYYKNKHMDLVCTPDHRCLIETRGGYQELVEAKDIPSDRKQYHTGWYKGGNLNIFSDDEVRLLLAIQADGSFENISSGIDFSFNKERKIDKLQNILNNLGLEYSCKERLIEGFYRIRVKPCLETDKFLDLIGKEKKFGPWILQLPRHQLDIICEEVAFWDGNFKRNTAYSSIIKINSDYIQAILVLSNKRCVLTAFSNNRKDRVCNSFNYELNWTERLHSWTTNLEQRHLENKEGKSYCVTVPSGVILIRRNGRCLVTGNCQQIPKGKMREIIKATPGYIFACIDYSYIELRTLAEILEKQFSKSVLADVIKSHKDPHAWTGAMLVNLSYEEFLETKKTKPEFYEEWRFNSKALNFGLAGGLGATKLLNYAKNVYGIKTWDINTATKFRNKLIYEIYPELSKYLTEDSAQILANALNCDIEQVWKEFDFTKEKNSICLLPIKNIICGFNKRNGDKYTENYIESVWNKLIRLNNNPSLIPLLNPRQPNIELSKLLFWGPTETLTGRIRGRVSFSQAKNSPFQGLAADGAKLAMYECIKKNVRMMSFIHDEIIFELKDLGGYVLEKDVNELLNIMCRTMEIVTPRIPIAGEYLVSYSWKKKGKMEIIDGKIYPRN